jgi:aminoglycoside phosphotransferase (APT) family kinase protein
VLRRKPPGELLPSAHAVDREFKAITAVGSAGFPVPQTRVLCEDDSVIGTMFYVMDFVEGRVFWDPFLREQTNEERTAMYDSMNATLAKLHTIDYDAVGLGDFGKPGNYFARQIGRWSKQYRLSESDKIPEMEKLIEWLPESIPAAETTTIVHGDFHIANIMFHPTEPRVIAALDWELCTLGDPLGDLTYHMMMWRNPKGMFKGPGLAGADLAPLGIPSEEEYIDLYCQRVGRAKIENLDFYFAYNFFRIGAILQGIYGRAKAGTASSSNADEFRERVPPLAKLGWEFARRAGAK